MTVQQKQLLLRRCVMPLNPQIVEFRTSFFRFADCVILEKHIADIIFRNHPTETPHGQRSMYE